MSDNDFMRRRQDAVERMREMSRKAAESSAQPMPPMPPFVRLQNRENQPQSQGSAASQQSVQTGPQASPASNEDSLSHTRKGGLSSLPFLDYAEYRRRSSADHRSAAYSFQRKGQIKNCFLH